MYLYNKNGDKLEVYHLMPKEKQIIEYKMEEMKKIPEEERVLKAVSNYRPKIQTCYSGVAFSSEIDYGNEDAFFHKYHRLIGYDEKDEAIVKKKLEEYYAQNYNWKTLEVDPYLDSRKYYLLQGGNSYGWEKRAFKPSRFKLDGIIQIPKSLYILHQLYFGYGDNLIEYDINKQMDLFWFNDDPKESYDFSRINSLMSFGLIDNTLNEEKIESHSKLVKRLKDYNRDYK